MNNPYGKCVICLQPFKVGDEIRRIMNGVINEKFGVVYKIPDYLYCLQCYSIHIEKND
jgi:hypothetical protein